MDPLPIKGQTLENGTFEIRNPNGEALQLEIQGSLKVTPIAGSNLSGWQYTRAQAQGASPGRSG